MTAPLLPHDWRRRLGLAPRCARFYVERMDDAWQLVDAAYGVTLGTPTKRAATDAARFARHYIARHGDIDLGSFPCSVDDPLTYDDRELAALTWARAK